MVFLACSVRTVLFMTSDGCGILLTNVGNSLITCSSRCTRRKMILMEYCSSGLHLQKSSSNHGQTHRGNAIVETPCRSPAEFAILLPNNSILVVDPKCSKAYIIQLKTCICTVVSICACLKPEERQSAVTLELQYKHASLASQQSLHG